MMAMMIIIIIVQSHSTKPLSHNSQPPHSLSYDLEKGKNWVKMMGQKPNTSYKDLFNETLINIDKRLDEFNEFWKRVTR